MSDYHYEVPKQATMRLSKTTGLSDVNIRPTLNAPLCTWRISDSVCLLTRRQTGLRPRMTRRSLLQTNIIERGSHYAASISRDVPERMLPHQIQRPTFRNFPCTARHQTRRAKLTPAVPRLYRSTDKRTWIKWPGLVCTIWTSPRRPLRMIWCSSHSQRPRWTAC